MNANNKLCICWRGYHVLQIYCRLDLWQHIFLKPYTLEGKCFFHKMALRSTCFSSYNMNDSIRDILAH